MQFSCMTYTLSVSKRGTLTLPPELRIKLKLNRLASPMVVLEEKNGVVTMQSAIAMPIRDIPKESIDRWILNDEADFKTYKKKKK